MVMQVATRTLGDKVRVARVSRRWTQVVLSMIAKVSQTTISRLERDLEVSDTEKIKVMKALDIYDEK